MSAPITMAVLLTVILGTLGFEAAVTGGNIIASSFPTLFNVSFNDCSQNGFWSNGFGLGTISCWFVNLGFVIIDFVLLLVGVVLICWNLISFNIPGAPVIVRAMVGSFFGFVIVYSGAQLFRGTSG